MTDWRYVESFAVDDPGAWFRILPVGTFRRFGRKVEITLDKLGEMVRNFGRVPETRIPVTVEHNDNGGKVGDIAELDVRPDGLYARVGWLERGLALLKQAAFQYFSPEIVWGPTDYDGSEVSNVLVGLSLVNSPYFGQATALYSLTDMENGNASPEGDFPIGNGPAQEQRGSDDNQSEEDNLDEKTLAQAIAEAFNNAFGRKPEPAPEPEVVETYDVKDTEEYKALAAQLDELKAAQVEAQAVAALNERVEKYSTALGEKFDVDADLPAMLARIGEEYPDEAEALVERFRSLASQVDTVKLFGEIGSTNVEDEVSDPADRFLARAEALVKDGAADTLGDAFVLIAKADPEGYAAYRSRSISR